MPSLGQSNLALKRKGRSGRPRGADSIWLGEQRGDGARMSAEHLGDLANREAGTQKRSSRRDGLEVRHTGPPEWQPHDANPAPLLG
jgi:hypothetical protein